MRQPAFSGTSGASASGVWLAHACRLRFLRANAPRLLRSAAQSVARPQARLAWQAVLVGMLSFDALAAVPDAAPAAADGVQRVAIVGGNYFFRPEHVVVKAGRGVEIAVRTEPGMVPHRFVLETAAGESVVDVSIDERVQLLRLDLPPGKYLFHCPNRLLLFKSHRERGMAGVLEVEE